MESLYINFAWAVGGIIFGYIGGTLLGKTNGGTRYRTVGGLVILILVALSAVLNYRNFIDLRASVGCQRAFNEQYRLALQAQLDASALESRAQDDFLAVFRGGDVTPSERVHAFDAYFQQKNSAEQLRKNHPIPLKNLCGGE